MNKSFSNYVQDSLIDKIENEAMADGIQRKVVGAVVVFGKQNVLLVRRSAADFMGGLVEIPSGAVVDGETLIDALKRELKEETGLDISSIERYVGHFDYLSKSGRKTRQFNFVVKTANAGVLLNPSEHDEYYIVPCTGNVIDSLNISKDTRGIIELGCGHITGFGGVHVNCN